MEDMQPPFLADVEDGGCASLTAVGALGVVGEVIGGGARSSKIDAIFARVLTRLVEDISEVGK